MGNAHIFHTVKWYDLTLCSSEARSITLSVGFESSYVSSGYEIPHAILPPVLAWRKSNVYYVGVYVCIVALASENYNRREAFNSKKSMSTFYFVHVLGDEKAK